MQQGSTESLNEAPLTDKAGSESAKGPSDLVIELEARMKILMQTTGGTSPADLLERFTAQKEAMQRLNYLRTVTESEKRHLEIERDELTSQFEQLKFSDTKENEVYVTTIFMHHSWGIPILILILSQKSRAFRTIEEEYCRQAGRRKRISASIKSLQIRFGVDQINHHRLDSEIARSFRHKWID